MIKTGYFFASRSLMPRSRAVKLFCLLSAFICVIAIAAVEAVKKAAAKEEAETSASSTAAKIQWSAPTLVKDINPGDASSSPEMFVPFNGAIYFRANDGVHGIELWKTDGTLAGTNLVTDLNPGIVNSLPDKLAVAGGSLYFTALIGTTGSKVFKSDGTAAGTVLLADTYPDLVPFFDTPLPANFTPFGSQVLFTALDELTGYELWRTDGTISGTYRVKDIHPGSEWSIPVNLTPLNDKVYFGADDKTTLDPGSGLPFYDRELFATDGTEAGTARVKDIFPGPMPSIPFDLKVFRKRLFFKADDGQTGAELWTSDGTEAGTKIFKDINPTGSSDPDLLTVAGNQIFFAANDGVTGSELWVSDGSEACTHLVKDINPQGNSLITSLTAVRDRVYFTADDGAHGKELWVSDGTADGTHLVKDINPGLVSSSPLDMLPVGNLLFFNAIKPPDKSGAVVTQLWMTDGTEAGTQLVWEAPGRATAYTITYLTLLDGKILFAAPAGVDADGRSINTELYSIAIQNEP